MRRLIAFILVVISLFLFINVSGKGGLRPPLHDPLGAVDRDAFDRITSYCNQLRDSTNIQIVIHVDSAIADEDIVSRAEIIVQDMVAKYPEEELVVLFLQTNGECYYYTTSAFRTMAEEKNVSNLDLIVMKEYELGGIDKALESFIANIGYIAKGSSNRVTESNESRISAYGPYKILVYQIIFALLFAIGLAILIFDFLQSKEKEETQSIPTPLFGGDFIFYNSSLFGSGLNPTKNRSLK